MTLTRLSALDGEAILPIADAKDHLRVLHDDEDATIASLRDAAVMHVERVAGVALAPADFEWKASAFSYDELPVRPITNATSVTADGVTTTTFTAGFATPPADLLAAAKLMLGHLYRNREATTADMSELPLGVDALIQPYRRVIV